MEITKLTPMTNIQILAGVPLTPAYSDIMSHSNATTQYQYFNGMTKFTMSSATPIRNGVVRVPYTADDLYDCNYIMWRNNNFSSKWFYGFITNVEWINLNVSEITIQIDVWETWRFNITQWFPCFVNRMHVNSDAIGDNIEPEPFDTTNIITRYVGTTDYGDDYYIATYYVPQGSYIPAQVGKLKHMCHLSIQTTETFPQFFQNELQPLIDVGLADNIIGAVMIPAAFVTGNAPVQFKTYEKTFSGSSFQNIDGYTPSNKKLLTFPYNAIRVQSQNGVQAQYRLEGFSNKNSLTFQVSGCPALDLCLYGCFTNYRGNSGGDILPHNMYSVVSGFPQPLLNSLQAIGFAQATTSAAFQASATLREVAHGLFKDAPTLSKNAYGETWAADLMNNLASFGEAALSGAENDMKRDMQPSMQSVQSLPSSTCSWAIWQGEFMITQECIMNQKARVYDKFLTKWGYAINATVLPNVSGRDAFNYVKTDGMLLKGNIPAEDLRAIKNIFDNGVTIWHQERGHTVGDWSGDASTNPIV